MGTNRINRIGILAEYDRLCRRIYCVATAEPFRQSRKLRFRVAGAGVRKRLKLGERLRLILEAVKFPTGALHGRLIAAMEVALQTLLRGFRNRLATIVGTKIFPADFDFGDGFFDVPSPFGNG